MDKRLNKAIEFINSHWGDKISMEKLAMEACASYRTLLRLFKTNLNITPYKYIERIKIQKSLELILLSEKSIQDISDEIGFKNYETFSKVFLKTQNISPGDLKEVLKFIRQTYLNQKCQTLKLEISSTALNDVSDYLTELPAHYSNNNCDAIRKTFIASQEPLSPDSTKPNVKNKFYVESS